MEQKKKYVVTTQKEMDAVPYEHNRWVEVRGNELIKVSDDYSCRLEVYDKSEVEVCGNIIVEAFDNAVVTANECALVSAYDNAEVEARSFSSVIAQDNATVYAYDKSSVEAFDNTTVYAFDNSSVEVYDNATANPSAHGQAKIKVHGKEEG